MRLAVYSPLPPEASGIADYTAELLPELALRAEVVAVVDDARFSRTEALPGIDVRSVAEVDPRAFDCCIYQMGNNSKYHRHVFRAALETPGLLVLHDPSLADFHAEICGGADSVVFRDELTYDRPELDPFDIPRVDIGKGLRDIDRLSVLFARESLHQASELW